MELFGVCRAAFAVVALVHNPFSFLVDGAFTSLPVHRNNPGQERNRCKERIITHLTAAGVVQDVSLCCTDTSGTQHATLRPSIFVGTVSDCSYPTPYKVWKGRFEDLQLPPPCRAQLGDASVAGSAEGPHLRTHRMPEGTTGTALRLPSQTTGHQQLLSADS